MDRLTDIVIFAQAAPAAGRPTTPQDLIWQAIPFVVIVGLFYFMLLLPERRKQRAMETMLKNLKKNDRVVIAGGILGTVASASKESDEVIVRVDENNNTRLHVLRSAIIRVLGGDSMEEAKGSS